MFDFYGTVVDMQGGLDRGDGAVPGTKGYTAPDRLVTWWRRTHFENSMIDALLHREHTPYREIGHQAVDYTLERAGIPHTDEEVRCWCREIEKPGPFPDVVEALKPQGPRLPTGHPLQRRSGHARSAAIPHTGVTCSTR